MKYSFRFTEYNKDVIEVEADNEYIAKDMAVDKWYLDNNVKKPVFTALFNITESKSGYIHIAEEGFGDIIYISVPDFNMYLINGLNVNTLEEHLYKHVLFDFINKTISKCRIDLDL